MITRVHSEFLSNYCTPEDERLKCHWRIKCNKNIYQNEKEKKKSITKLEGTQNNNQVPPVNLTHYTEREDTLHL